MNHPDNSLHLAGPDDTSLNLTVKSERICNDDASSTGLLTCAVCNKTVKYAKWQDHAFNEHYYIAWPIGEDPIVCDIFKLVHLSSCLISACTLPVA